MALAALGWLAAPVAADERDPRAGWLDAKVDVHTRGGVLSIEWAGALDPNGHVFMTGPAETSFEGEIEL